MGFALEEEQNELVSWRDTQEGKTTARYLAPAISEFVRNEMNESEAASDEEMHILREAHFLDQVWGRWDDNISGEGCHPQPDNDSSKTARWECREIPPAAKDPLRIPDNFNQGKRNQDEPIAEQLLRRGDDKGFVRIFEKTVTWHKRHPLLSGAHHSHHPRGKLDPG